MHLGQPHSSFIRQVANQSSMPRQPPHYEVVINGKPWRLRPGATNMMEALALLLLALRTSNLQSYAGFPALLREAAESGGTSFFNFREQLSSWFRTKNWSALLPWQSPYPNPAVMNPSFNSGINPAFISPGTNSFGGAS